MPDRLHRSERGYFGDYVMYSVQKFWTTCNFFLLLGKWEIAAAAYWNIQTVYKNEVCTTPTSLNVHICYDLPYSSTQSELS